MNSYEKVRFSFQIFFSEQPDISMVKVKGDIDIDIGIVIDTDK